MNFTHSVLWLDLGVVGGVLRRRNPFDRWHDHGMGLLCTCLRKAGCNISVASTRTVRRMEGLRRHFRSADVLFMNVRSYTFPYARQAARIFKRVNPKGVVIVGGMHAMVAMDEMLETQEFDRICSGPGDGIVAQLAADPSGGARVVQGQGATRMDDWPVIDRTLFPRSRLRRGPWPLEPAVGWGAAPVATMLTSRVCPWQCSFCNENTYIPHVQRRSVDSVIDELNMLDERYGPIGSVVLHDSMFFMNKVWLEEWLQSYPRKARRAWPYWATARSDMIRRWPELFEALVRDTNWSTVSIGLESGSDTVLETLNKGCTVEDNRFAIDLINRVGADLEKQGRAAPRIWANIILAVPGETRQDAFQTMALVERMRYPLPSITFFSPYPGSVLGDRVIAEGNSLMTRDNYHRYPGEEKVRGIDYDFYRTLLAGGFQSEIEKCTLG